MTNIKPSTYIWVKNPEAPKNAKKESPLVTFQSEYNAFPTPNRYFSKQLPKFIPLEAAFARDKMVKRSQMGVAELEVVSSNSYGALVKVTGEVGQINLIDKKEHKALVGIKGEISFAHLQQVIDPATYSGSILFHVKGGVIQGQDAGEAKMGLQFNKNNLLLGIEGGFQKWGDNTQFYFGASVKSTF